MAPPDVKRFLRRLAAAALWAGVPKCVLCSLAYAGLFGLGTELCGETPAWWPAVLPVAIAAPGVGWFLLPARGRRIPFPPS